jgi:hypothetical protein
MKTLNYVHIPKTGGKSFQNLIPILSSHGLSTFTPKSISFNGYDSVAYVQTHYGSDASDKVPEINTACIFRDPLDRLVSQFAWAMMEGVYVQAFEEYENSDIAELLRYFLFKDEKFVDNSNVQARFICNPIDTIVFHLRHVSSNLTPEVEESSLLPVGAGMHWGAWLVSDTKTSIEYAKEQIDKMTIIDTVENHDRFVSKMCGWFLENYGIDVEQEFKDSLINENPTFNYSIFTDAGGKTWTTADLKALLTPDEVAKVYENNSLDLEIYNYVKAKLV